MEKTILLTGSGGPAGVNVAKSILQGNENLNLIGTDINKYHIEFIKDYVKKSYVVPKYDKKEYLDSILKIIKENDINLIHSQPDVEVRVISENRHRLPLSCKTFLPSKRTVRICQDKDLSARIWERNGFPSVESIPIKYDHEEDDVKYAFEKLGKKIWIRATVGAGGAGSTLAENVETGVNWVKYWKSRNKEWKFIAQPYLDGNIYAFQSIWKDGELITSQARQRDEYIYPYLAPSGVTGTPVVAHTVHNEAVNKCAIDAVLAIDEHATGIFCVDIREITKKVNFIRDHDPCPSGVINKIPMPTEINVGRFFTTSYFFARAGLKYNQPCANMPYLMTKLAFDEPIDKDIPKTNCLPKDLYWIRHIDCGYKLIEGELL
jgi:carbamoyl-phosphate synthase large subunit